MTENLWHFIQNYAPTIATIFFFLFFCHVVYTLFKKGQENKFNDYAKIPFNEEENLTQNNTQNLDQINSNKNN